DPTVPDAAPAAPAGPAGTAGPAGPAGPASPAVPAVPAVPASPAGPAGTAGPAGSGAGVDRILVPRRRGAIVEAAAAPDAPPGTGTLSLVTDAGLRYPLASPDLLGVLGYSGVTPQRVPAGLVALLPSGPPLDPAALRLAGNRPRK